MANNNNKVNTTDITTDLEIRIMEERLKIARIRNMSLKQQLDNLDAANTRLEKVIDEKRNKIFWDDINRDLMIALRVTPMSSQADIVSSAYIHCSYNDLESIGLVQTDYFAFAN